MPPMPVTRSMSSSGGWLLVMGEGAPVVILLVHHAAGRDGISRTAHHT
jgi:hypothetical protein